MREEVLAITVAVLGFYLASLAFSFQQISDNLTYKLIKPYNRNTVCWLIAFIVLIGFASWSVYCGDRDCGNRILNGDAISWIVMGISIVLVLVLSWRLFDAVFNFESNIHKNLLKLAPQNKEEVVQSILTISLANREFGRIQNVITSTKGKDTQPAVLEWLTENLQYFSNESLQGRIVKTLQQQMDTEPSDELLAFLKYIIFGYPVPQQGNAVALAFVEDLKTKTSPSDWDVKVLEMLLQDHNRFKNQGDITNPLSQLLPLHFAELLNQDESRAILFFQKVAERATGYIAWWMPLLVNKILESNLDDHRKADIVKQLIPVLAKVYQKGFTNDFDLQNRYKLAMLQRFKDMKASGLINEDTQKEYGMRVTGQELLHPSQL